ncbi:MAG TPA: dienelactone hydrolase family protein [Marinagarivorans sp.]
MTTTIKKVWGEGAPTHAIIWLHGLGATADDFVPVIPYLGLAQERTIRFVFPQAPDRAITLNGGYVMPGWYDIKGSDLSDKEDLPGITQSQKSLETLIDEQVSMGVASENIIIAGFSQGGAVAYYTGLRLKHKIAGILALSTYLPFASKAEAEHSAVNLKTPIMAMHGRDDAIVPFGMGKMSADAVSALGYKVEWKDYAMDHSVIPDQLVDIGRWINGVFNKN